MSFLEYRVKLAEQAMKQRLALSRPATSFTQPTVGSYLFPTNWTGKTHPNWISRGALEDSTQTTG